MWKEILRPGRWTLRNGDIFDCAPSDLPFYADRLNHMIARGLLVPACWEHQKRAVPMSQEAWHDLHTDVAKHTITHLKGAEIRDGVLGVHLEPEPEDLQQLKKTGYVSPYIDWDYIDPRGTLWEGPSILHVAVTPVPIQIDQKPFAAKGGDGAFLSSVAQWKKTPKKTRQPVWLSGARLQPIALGANMADDKKKGNDDEEIVVDDAPADETPEPTPAPAPPPPPAPAPLEADMRIKEALACAAYEGLVLGNDTTIENFLDRFITACRTKRAVEDKLKAEQEPEVEEPTEPASSEPGGDVRDATPGPVMMSQAEVTSLKTRHDAYAQQLKTMHLTGIATEIRRYSKELGDDGVKRLLDKLNKAPMALSQSGSLEECKPLIEIEATLAVIRDQRQRKQGKGAFTAQLSSKAQTAKPHDGTGNVPDLDQSKKNGQDLAARYLGSRGK